MKIVKNYLEIPFRTPSRSPSRLNFRGAATSFLRCFFTNFHLRPVA